MYTFGIVWASTPWALPGTVAGAAFAVVAGPWVARCLRMPWPGAVLLLGSVAGIVVFTSLPTQAAIDGPGALAPICSFAGWRPTANFLTIDGRSLNVLLFLPLGICTLLPRAWRHVLWLVMGGTALPFVIESAKALLPLGHTCDSRDIADNLLGFGAGAGIGAISRVVVLPTYWKRR